MNVQVRLFSLLRDRAGAAQAELELGTGATVGNALEELGRRFPALAPFLDGSGGFRALAAVNRDYAEPGMALHEGDELALLPPVSGGSPMDHGLLLLSGGFDSPVAGHLVLRSGRSLDAIHFTQEPFTDDASAHKALRLAEILKIGRIFLVPLGEELAEFARRCDHRVYFVLLKRLMLRIAQIVAVREGATFLVTGENLGQVSSQTLPNLGAIDAATTMPVLRPLLGLDKHEIVARARTIGTFETSKGPELCDLLGPRHPNTNVSREQADREEALVDIPGFIDRALGRMRVHPLVPVASV